MWNIFGDGPLEWSEDADAAQYARIDGPLAWQQHALCAQTDPEAFFPEKGGSTREAKAVCQACQVREECLEYALANDERFGIWGGLDELVKTLGFGGAVLMQDPPPLLRRKAGTLRVGATNRVAEVAGAADAHELGTVGNSISGERGDVAPCDVNDGQRMRGHRLILDGPQNGLGQRRFSPCDKDRTDGALRRTQPAIRRRRRLSRSDMPPQMPKRSSLASAYSRQSSRTWHA